MSTFRIPLLIGLLVSLAIQGYGAPFAMFPKSGRLISPDRRLEVRDVDQREPGSEFAGVFHSLWLVEIESGRSRKLCDYVGVAAVAWSKNDDLVVTQYLSKKTSRAMVFTAASGDEPVLIATSTLLQIVPVEMRPSLRENDHLFVEASRLEEETFYFQVWGYGQHDRNGFHWNCEYKLNAGSLRCETRKSAVEPIAR